MVNSAFLPFSTMYISSPEGPSAWLFDSRKCYTGRKSHFLKIKALILLLVQAPVLSSLVFRKVYARPQEETGMQQYWGEKRDPGKLFWDQLNSERQSEPHRETHEVHKRLHRRNYCRRWQMEKLETSVELMGQCDQLKWNHILSNKMGICSTSIILTPHTCNYQEKSDLSPSFCLFFLSFRRHLITESGIDLSCMTQQFFKNYNN